MQRNLRQLVWCLSLRSKVPKLFICDVCVDACIDTLATKDRGWRERQINYLLRLRHRREQIAQPPANPN